MPMLFTPGSAAYAPNSNFPAISPTAGTSYLQTLPAQSAAAAAGKVLPSPSASQEQLLAHDDGFSTWSLNQLRAHYKNHKLIITNRNKAELLARAERLRCSITRVCKGAQATILAT